MPKARFDVELTRGAEDDLEAIFDYLAENVSVEVATDVLDRLLNKVESLERYPLRGHVPKELESVGIQEFRQILVRHYRLIYRVLQQRVFIMIIADGRRDMLGLLERRLLGRGI